MTPIIGRPRHKCRLLTGAWRLSGDREVWSGFEGKPSVPCGYEGGPHTLLCHLIATHRIPLEAARASVKELEP